MAVTAVILPFETVISTSTGPYMVSTTAPSTVFVPLDLAALPVEPLVLPEAPELPLEPVVPDAPVVPPLEPALPRGEALPATEESGALKPSRSSPASASEATPSPARVGESIDRRGLRVIGDSQVREPLGVDPRRRDAQLLEGRSDPLDHRDGTADVAIAPGDVRDQRVERPGVERVVRELRRSPAPDEVVDDGAAGPGQDVKLLAEDDVLLGARAVDQRQVAGLRRERLEERPEGCDADAAGDERDLAPRA